MREPAFDLESSHPEEIHLGRKVISRRKDRQKARWWKVERVWTDVLRWSRTLVVSLLRSKRAYRPLSGMYSETRRVQSNAIGTYSTRQRGHCGRLAYIQMDGKHPDWSIKHGLPRSPSLQSLAGQRLKNWRRRNTWRSTSHDALSL